MNRFEIRNNKKIYIYGNGRMAQAFVLYLKQRYPDYRSWIGGCVVTSIVGRIKSFEGMKVYSIDEVMNDDEEKYIYIAVRDKYYEEIKKQLELFNFSCYERVDFELLKEELEELWRKKVSESKKFEERVDFSNIPFEEYIMFLALQTEDSVIDFEINIADNCNLNCQSCNHFSPIATCHYIDKEKMRDDLKRMNELFGEEIRNVMLLGGEPLLHPSISELMYVARDSLPSAHLQLYTNGIKLPQMDEDFWVACKENRIEILITKYPIKFDYSKCDEVAKANDVQLGCNWESAERIKTTYKLPIRREQGDEKKKYTNFVLCDHANRCVVVRDGRIYTCPFAAYIDLLNKFFNTKYPELHKNSISIYENDSNTIKEFLRKTNPLCSYCDVEAYQWNIPWRTSEKRIEEWVD